MRRLLLLVCLLAASPVFAQADRYELGRRAHAFEVAWDEKIDDAAAKKRAAPFVNQAVQQFFMLKFDGAGKELDAARHALESADPAPPAVRWADSLQIIPELRMVDASAKDLTVTVKRFYKPDAEAPKSPVVRLKLGAGTKVEVTLGLLPEKVKVPVKDVPGPASADFKLTAEILLDGKVLATKVVGVSRVENLEERLAGVKKSFAEVPNPPKTIEDASFGLLIKTLTDVAKKETPETDLPLSRFLAGAERLSKIDEPYYLPSRPGEFWLGIPTEKAKTATVIRIRIPAKLEERKDPVPVLVALHGAGGSENVYFDGYGNGVIPRLASERGWIVVAPRVEGFLGAGPAPPVAAVLDALAKRYPIDPKRVYLVGHSMGASQAVQLAQQDAGRYTAVAALGGGGRLTKPESLKDLPFFVGCGKQDFAINAARALHKTLDTAKVPATLKEYDDIEHLTIVREAAGDVFKFFDGTKK